MHLAARCGMCSGVGYFFEDSPDHVTCEHCGGVGWFGIDPKMPVMAHPGSVAKVAMLSVRYSSGVPLWNAQDSVGPQPVAADAFAETGHEFTLSRHSAGDEFSTTDALEFDDELIVATGL
jgi:hypothetical protein